MKTPHHAQVKMAAALGLMIGVTDTGYALTGTVTGAVVSEGTDLKALLTAAAKAAAPAKAPKPKKVKAKAKKKTKSEDEGDEDEEEPADEDEEDDGKSVVKSKYKALYAQSKVKNSNDDSFAKALKDFTSGEEGEIDMAALMTVAKANDVATSQYKSRNRGWQGRLRMTVGNRLRGMVRKGTDVTVGDKVFKGQKQKVAKAE